VPKIVAVFDNIQAELPLLTRVLIATSGFLTDYGIWLLAGLVLLVVGTVMALRQESVRSRLDAVLLRLPMFGRLLRAADTARAARTLAVLIGSGVPVLDALKLAAPTLKRLPLREGMKRAAARVREGASLGRGLTEARVFPAVALRLVGSGEKSGRLPEMLDAAADHLARDVRQAMAVTNAILSPVLILVVGAIVLAIVLAILLPIFELNTLIGK
jgi:general secretion pathway protein F